MFKQMKKEITSRVLPKFFVLLLLAFLVLCVGYQGISFLIQGPKVMDSLALDELEGSYVETEVYAILDNFAEYYEVDDSGDETTTYQYYIIPVGENEYIGLQTDSDNFDIANQICDETYEYIMGDRSELSTTFKVKGTISTMEEDVYDYYNDWFQTSGYLENPTQEEIDSVALPYILKVDYIGGQNDYILYAEIGISILLILLAIIILIKLLSGYYLKNVKSYIKNNASLMDQERMEYDYQNAFTVPNFRTGKLYTYFYNGNRAMVVSTESILWAYLENVTHRTYGIKTGTKKSLIICTKNRKKYTIPMKSEAIVLEALQALSQTQPAITLGYHDDLNVQFQKRTGIFTQN